MQGAFNTLVRLLYQVGLQTNIRNTVLMVFHPFQAAGNQSEAAYKRRMTGEVLSYRESQRVRVKCSECGEDISVVLQAVYQQMNHGKVAGGRSQWYTTAPGG